MLSITSLLRSPSTDEEARNVTPAVKMASNTHPSRRAPNELAGTDVVWSTLIQTAMNDH